VCICYGAGVSQGLRDKFKALRLAAEMKERDDALALSAAEKQKRAEEAARDAALDAVVGAFRAELPEAVALLAEVGIAAHATDDDALVVGAQSLRIHRVGQTLVIEENGRPGGMLELPKASTAAAAATPSTTHKPKLEVRYVDGRAFEGVAERLAKYLDAIVTAAQRRR
jgi:hypothetical protein